jgi:hypothetical protein
VTEELLRRGYAEADVHKVLGGNVLRALRDAGRVAEELRKATPPDVEPPRERRRTDRRGGSPATVAGRMAARIERIPTEVA